VTMTGGLWRLPLPHHRLPCRFSRSW
jgi:hypothetical protein